MKHTIEFKTPSESHALINAMNADAMESAWMKTVDYLSALGSHSDRVSTETIIDAVNEILTEVELDDIAEFLHYSPVGNGEL